MANTRFTVANHILALLAAHPGELLTSEFIAGSVNTNPVVVRRLLGPLRQAGLVQAQLATGGGWRLARRPDEISLLSVHQAVDDVELFPMHGRLPNPTCVVGRNIQHALEGVYAEAREALEERLERETIADVLGRVLDPVGTRRG